MEYCNNSIQFFKKNNVQYNKWHIVLTVNLVSHDVVSDTASVLSLDYVVH